MLLRYNFHLPLLLQMFVEEFMDLVELNPLRNALVGLPGVDGLSTEQRKRLTIAVELVANPSIIFMDEPTSGLDARAAAVVMRTVRNTVNTGRTMVCTIHQPSIDIFEAFDEVHLIVIFLTLDIFGHSAFFNTILIPAATLDEERRTSDICWTSWSPFSQTR